MIESMDEARRIANNIAKLGPLGPQLIERGETA
jgi:hypothetical protein